MPWATVALTPAMLLAASEHERAVLSTHTLRTTENYTGLVAPGRYRVGYLGESALAALFDEHDVRYDWLPRADGRPDSRDLIVYVTGAPYNCEVKTASQPHHQYLMQPVSQGRHRGDRGALVGVRLNEASGYAEVAGYVHHDHFLRAARVLEPPEHGVHVPTRLLPLDSLVPIERMLVRLDLRPADDGSVFGDGATEDPGPGPDESLGSLR